MLHAVCNSNLPTVGTRLTRVLLLHMNNEDAMFSALYSSRFVSRSNFHPWSFLFPTAPPFYESLFSSSRMSLRSPTANFSTPPSTHRCMMCLLRV